MRFPVGLRGGVADRTGGFLALFGCLALAAAGRRAAPGGRVGGGAGARIGATAGERHHGDDEHGGGHHPAGGDEAAAVDLAPPLGPTGEQFLAPAVRPFGTRSSLDSASAESIMVGERRTHARPRTRYRRTAPRRCATPTRSSTRSRRRAAEDPSTWSAAPSATCCSAAAAADLDLVVEGDAAALADAARGASRWSSTSASAPRRSSSTGHEVDIAAARTETYAAPGRAADGRRPAPRSRPTSRGATSRSTRWRSRSASGSA